MSDLDIAVSAVFKGEDLEGFLKWTNDACRMAHRVYVFDGRSALIPRTPSAAWNDLGRAGKAPYIAFIKTDVVLTPGWDVNLVQCLEKHSKIGAVIPAFFGEERPVKLVAEGPEAPIGDGIPTASDMNILADWATMFEGVFYFYEECNAPFSAVVVRRKEWEKLKGFDERFRMYGHDHELQRRLKTNELLTVSVRSCAAYAKTGAFSIDEISRRTVDVSKEQGHILGLKAEPGKLWHKLWPWGRRKVRRNSLFSSLPLVNL